MNTNAPHRELDDRPGRFGVHRRRCARTVLAVSALVATSVGAFGLGSVGAADPGSVVIAVDGSVDCPSGNKTVEVTASYDPTDDVARVELGSATVTFDDADRSVTRVIEFDPATLTPRTSSAVATTIGPGGASVTITVPYTVTMTDGTTHEATAGVVLDVAAPPAVCPSPPASTETPSTTDPTDLEPTTTVAGGSGETAPVAHPAAGRPDYTG